jgi:acetyl-CoA carboxylase carboxyl transferase subunit beta
MSDFISERKKRIQEFKDRFFGKDKNKPIDIPDGLFVKCDECGTALYEKELEQKLSVCPNCGHHFRIGARKRITITVDAGSFCEVDQDLISVNPLSMPDYEVKIASAKKLTNQNEAFVGGSATIFGYPCYIGVLDSYFMMGSMGSVVGEKVTRLIEYATKDKRPLVLFSASGGARMQEGILSLMQMAKTSGALYYLNQAGVLFISIMTNPTTGGVAASFASLGDINIAEKTATIGFAGARVIKQTIKQDLPPHFQTAEFQLEKGQVDLVLSRHDIRPTLAKLLLFHGGQHV